MRHIPEEGVIRRRASSGAADSAIWRPSSACSCPAWPAGPAGPSATSLRTSTRSRWRLTRRSPGVGWRRPSDQGRLNAAGTIEPFSKLSASPVVCAGGEWLRPRGDAAILLDHQERGRRTLRRVQDRPRRVVRRSREALQPAASSSDTRPEQSGRVRATGGCASTSDASPATQSDQSHRRQHPSRRFARCAAVGRVIIGGLGSADLLGWDSRAPAAVCNAGGES